GYRRARDDARRRRLVRGDGGGARRGPLPLPPPGRPGRARSCVPPSARRPRAERGRRSRGVRLERRRLARPAVSRGRVLRAARRRVHTRRDLRRRRNPARPPDPLPLLGITAIELMPLGEAPGRWNWGYDGVYLFAPEARYGPPDALKRLVCAAHARGLMVFVDVVYNHFGPEGNYLRLYAPAFFTARHRTPWGDAIDFEGPQSRAVRDFFIQNALYWLEEFHVDGLRVDAVHAIHDTSTPDILV